jgi:hypothetical protein
MTMCVYVYVCVCKYVCVCVYVFVNILKKLNLWNFKKQKIQQNEKPKFSRKNKKIISSIRNTLFIH